MRAMRRLTPLLVIALLLAGCASQLYPLSTGFHAPGDGFVEGTSRERYVVWSNHPGVAQYLTGVLLQGGHTVVERAQLEQVFREQKIRLLHTPESEADLLHVGRLVGATQVIFAEVQPTTFGRLDREPRVVRVDLRSVHVESATVRWAGSATLETSGPFIIDSPERGTIGLAWVALTRATCRTERGWRWVEPGPGKEAGKTAGCLAPGTGQMTR